MGTFSHFLESDDVARGNRIERSADEELIALVDAVEPLYDEINTVLDRLVAKPHPLADEDATLEDGLNSLAQAGMEARLELTDRATPSG